MSPFLVFRAIAQFFIQCHLFFSLVWHSEPFFIPIQAFDVTIFLSFRCFEPSFISAFRAIAHIRLGTLSRHLSVFLTFKVVSPQSYLLESQFWHSCSCSLALRTLPSVSLFICWPRRVRVTLVSLWGSPWFFGRVHFIPLIIHILISF